MSQPRCRFFHTNGFLWIPLFLFVAGSSSDARALPFQIIVHADNPLSEISVGTASRIFLGKVPRWPGGGEITPLDLPPDSPVRVEFTHGVHGKSVAAIENYWQRMLFSRRRVPPAVQSPGTVVETVRTLPGAIAYASTEMPLPAGVKRLQIIEDNQPSQPIQSTAIQNIPEGTSQAGIPLPRGVKRLQTSEDHQPSQPIQSTATQSIPEGMLLALEVSPSSLHRVWASFHSRGLRTSSDGGLTWAPTPTSPDSSLRALAFDPLDPQFLLVGSENGLYRSLDLGNQWQTSLLQADREVDLQGIQRIALLPQSPGTFIVHTSTALLRSDDRGETFYKLQLPGWPQAFTVDTSNETLWIFANGSFHLSVDRGASWVQNFRFPENPPVTQILIAELFGEKTLWIATDRGLLHGQIDAAGLLVGDLKRSSLQEISVQRLAAIENTIYAMTQRGVFRLADDGQTWQRIAEVQGALLAADPFNVGWLYAGGSEGRLWKREHPNAPWQHVFYINNPRPSATTLTTLKKPPPPPPPPIPLMLRCRSEAGHVGALAVHPNKLGVLWAGSEHGVFRSEDGGASWGPPGRGLLISDVHSLTVDPQTPTTLWAGTHGGGVHVSRDRGDTWVPAPQLARTAVHEVMVDPLVPELLYAATSSGVFVSSDGGARWRRPQALNERGQRIFSEDPNWQITPRTLAVEPKRIPAVLGDGLGRLFDVHAVSATRQSRTGLVSLPKKRFGKSQCADIGWQLDDGPETILQPQLPLRDLAFASAADGTTSPWAATPFGLWRGTQGKEISWQRLPLNTNVVAVAFDPHAPERIYVAAVDGLWRSVDGGVSWEIWGIRTPVFSLALDPGPSELIYVGLAGGRVASVRPTLPGLEPEVFSTTVPPRVEEAVNRSKSRVVSSVRWLHQDSLPVNPDTAFWQAWASTPEALPHLRALYSIEVLSRVKGSQSNEIRRNLKGTLAQILDGALLHGREIPIDFGLAPGGRWFFSEWRFHDGLRGHSELRLYAAAAQGWRSATATASSESFSNEVSWMKLHDLAFEPQHLLSSWLFEDPGTFLAWSNNGTRLASLKGPDQLLLWKVPQHVPERMARATETRVVQLQRGQTPIGDYSMLSDSGSWLAIARHGTNLTQKKNAATLTLFHLGRLAEMRHLDIQTSPAGDFSPTFTKLLFTGDERHLLGFRADGSAQVWPVALDGKGKVIPLGQHFEAVHRDPHGRWLATVTGDGSHRELKLWSLDKSGDFTSYLLTSGPEISRIRFHDDGTWLSAVVGESQAHLWDLTTPSPAANPPNLPPQPPREKAIEEDTRSHHEPTLVATARGACMAVFDSRGDWLTHERSASRRWSLRKLEPDGRLVRSTKPKPKWMSGGGFCSQISQASEEAGALLIGPKASHDDLHLWDLSQSKPRYLHAQMQRFGPSELHRDEGVLRSPRHILQPRPELDELSDDELSLFTCKLTGRPLTREEWSFAMGTAPYRPLCLPPAEP